MMRLSSSFGNGGRGLGESMMPVRGQFQQATICLLAGVAKLKDEGPHQTVRHMVAVPVLRRIHRQS